MEIFIGSLIIAIAFVLTLGLVLDQREKNGALSLMERRKLGKLRRHPDVAYPMAALNDGDGQEVEA